MPINPTDAKKMAQQFNTMDLKSMIDKNDEMMRMVMEAGDMDAAVKAAEDSAKASAALIVRKNDVRELAKRVRERVAQEGSAKEESGEEKENNEPTSTGESAEITENPKSE